MNEFCGANALIKIEYLKSDQFSASLEHCRALSNVDRLIVLVFLCAMLASATRVKINNYCSQQLLITESVFNYERIGCKQSSPDGANLLCKLRSGTYCYKDYTEGVTVWFQNEYAYNVTHVEIWINSCYNSVDKYGIHIDYGFDLPLQVSSFGDPILTCTDLKCPDSYDNDNSKFGNVTTGGVITINYCPGNTEAFATNELNEIIRGPFAINPKHKPVTNPKHKPVIEKEGSKKA